MDKETLSNYGWIVICVLVMAVMIALAGPFGTFVADAVKSTSNGLFDVNQEALGAAGITIADNELTKYTILDNPETEVERGDVIVLRSEADVDKFVKVTANGEEVPEKYYTVTEGSTIVTFTVEFSRDYTGTYVFEIVSNDGTAKITVTIEDSIYYGDVDMDGRITEKDVTMIQEYVVNKITLTEEQKDRADVDGDNLITAKDTTCVLQYIEGMRDSFPVDNKPIIEKNVYYGDVDMDGRITKKDATMIQEYVANKITLTEEQKDRAKVAGKTYVSVVDASLILQYIAGTRDSFPVEQ